MENKERGNKHPLEDFLSGLLNSTRTGPFQKMFANAAGITDTMLDTLGSLNAEGKLPVQQKHIRAELEVGLSSLELSEKKTGKVFNFGGNAISFKIVIEGVDVDPEDEEQVQKHLSGMLVVSPDEPDYKLLVPQEILFGGKAKYVSANNEKQEETFVDKRR